MWFSRPCLHFLLILLLVGCSGSSTTQQQESGEIPQSLRQAYDSTYARTSDRFQRAVFLSPDPESTVDDQRWMAPLIVQQLDTEQPENTDWTHLGALASDGDGGLVIETEVPTVYLNTEPVVVNETEMSQSIYLWFYSPQGPESPYRWRGIRMLVGPQGYAIAWEILSSDHPLRVFCVSKATEDAAREEYGVPLPGRHFSVEPDPREHPQVVVARTVGDGPQPMGPFIYLDFEALLATTLICRCEPSQADTFPESLHYQLATWEELNESLQSVSETLREQLRLPGSEWPLRLP